MRSVLLCSFKAPACRKKRRTEIKKSSLLLSEKAKHFQKNLSFSKKPIKIITKQAFFNCFYK